MCWFNYVSTTSALIWYQVRQVLELRAFANERQAKGGGLAKHKQNLTLCLVSLVWNPAKLCWVYGVCLSRAHSTCKTSIRNQGQSVSVFFQKRLLSVDVICLWMLPRVTDDAQLFSEGPVCGWGQVRESSLLGVCGEILSTDCWLRLSWPPYLM